MSSFLSERLRDAQRRQQQPQDGPGLSPQRPRRSRADPGAEGSAQCPRHDSPLDIYCCTDEEVICGVCALQEHRGHRIGCVGEERRRKQVHNSNKPSFKSMQISSETAPAALTWARTRVWYHDTLKKPEGKQQETIWRSHSNRSTNKQCYTWETGRSNKTL